MSNCIIYLNGSDEIQFFIKDCQVTDDPKKKTGLTFTGSNMSIGSVKPQFSSIKWTNAEPTPIHPNGSGVSGYAEKVSEIPEATFFQGEPVTTSEDVKVVVKERIKDEYALEDEIKILRKKILGTLPDEEWDAYNNYVESLLSEADDFKRNTLKENDNG